MKLGLGIVLSTGTPLSEVLDRMTLPQISLVAECVTLARVDFVQTVIMEPALALVQAVVKKKPQTARQRAEEVRRKGKKKTRKTGPMGKDAQKRAEARDAHNLQVAAALGIQIEDA